IACAHVSEDLGYGDPHSVAGDMGVQLERCRVGQSQLCQIKALGQILTAECDLEVEAAEIEGLEHPAVGGGTQIACLDVELERVGVLRIEVDQRSARHVELERLLVDGTRALDAKRRGILFGLLLTRVDGAIDLQTADVVSEGELAVSNDEIAHDRELAWPG